MRTFINWICKLDRAGLARIDMRRGGRSKLVLALVGAMFGAVFGANEASAETRALKVYNTHTQESATIVFKRNGRYDADGLKKLNWFMRDWRRDEMIKMDPRLFDIVWEVYQKVGASQPIHVVSGYRSPVTNNALRARSRGVAKRSQHTLGKAMDYFIPGVPLSRIREAGLRLQQGGVGFYPTSRSPFVHMDTGNVRHWPRMTRQQLVRLFPDGRTIHVPSDGKPLSGYQLALADLKSGRRAPSAAVYASASDSGKRTKSKGLLASLFSSGESDDEEISAAEATPGRKPQAEMRSYPPTAKTEVAPGIEAKPPLPAAAPVAARPTTPPAPAPTPAMKPAEPEETPADKASDMLIAAVPMPIAKPRNAPIAVASATPAPRNETGQQMQWVAGPAPAPAEAPAPAAPVAEVTPAAAPAKMPSMLIAETDLRLPSARPTAPAMMASAAPLQTMPPIPMDRPGALSGPASLPLPLPARLPAYASDTTGSTGAAAGAALALASGGQMPATIDRQPDAGMTTARGTATDTAASTSHLLAYNGSDIRPLAGKASARTRALAQLKAPIISKPTVFETPVQAIENHFGAAGGADLRTDRFSGPAIGRIATVWLGLTGR